MGWLDSIDKRKKEKIPKIFDGKSEDDIVKMLEDTAKDKDTIVRLQEKVKEQDTAVANITTEFDSVKARLAAAEANHNTPLRKENDEEPANFVEEPDKAFGQRVAPVLNIAVQNSAITSRILAQQQLDNSDLASGGKTMDGRLFRAWAAEIDAASKKYQAIQLTSPDAWIGIYFHIKGLHADELSNPEARKKKYGFLEPSAPSTVVNQEDNSNKPANEQLTAQELHIAEKMGVTPENYLKRKKQMSFANA